MTFHNKNLWNALKQRKLGSSILWHSDAKQTPRLILLTIWIVSKCHICIYVWCYQHKIGTSSSYWYSSTSCKTIYSSIRVDILLQSFIFNMWSYTQTPQNPTFPSTLDVQWKLIMCIETHSIVTLPSTRASEHKCMANVAL